MTDFIIIGINMALAVEGIMETNKKHILFLTPSLSRTGSEILMFDFINFLAKRYTISVICYSRGNLIQLLNPSVKVHVLNFSIPKTVYQKIVNRIRLHFILPALLHRYKNSLWYINTLLLPSPVEFAVKHRIDFILHAHELKHRYNLLSKGQLDVALSRPRLLIANSQLSKEDMLEAGSKKDINIIYPFVDWRLIASLKSSGQASASIDHCWVMAGSIDTNKNPELFMKIAGAAQRRNLPYVFMWLYHSIPDPALFSKLSAELAAHNLPVRFVQTRGYEDYIAHFSKAAGFILTSTFESFSIVTLEALALSLPLVLNDCGGVREIVDDTIASLVPLNSNMDVYLMCMEKELKRSDDLRAEKNKIARTFDKIRILADWEKLMLTSID